MLSSLNKSQTYIGLQYGKGFISNKIRKYSKVYYPDCVDVPTHVLFLKYSPLSFCWHIYEAHAKGDKKLNIPSGVRKLNERLWQQFESDSQDQFKFYPVKLDTSKVDTLLGLPYSFGDIKGIMFASLLGKNNMKDHNGYICSEVGAIVFPQICSYFDLKPYQITPIHFQKYFDENNIQPAN